MTFANKNRKARFRCLLLRPDPFYSVCIKHAVTADNSYPLHFRLRYQKPVKRVSVMEGQLYQPREVAHGDIQQFDRVDIQLFPNELFKSCAKYSLPKLSLMANSHRLAVLSNILFCTFSM